MKKNLFPILVKIHSQPLSYKKYIQMKKERESFYINFHFLLTKCVRKID